VLPGSRVLVFKSSLDNVEDDELKLLGQLDVGADTLVGRLPNDGLGASKIFYEYGDELRHLNFERFEVLDVGHDFKKYLVRF